MMHSSGQMPVGARTGPARPEGPAARPERSEGGAFGGGGRLSDLVAAETSAGFAEAFPPATLAKIAVLAALFVAVHHALLVVLVKTWIRESNWHHGFIIPLFSLYLLYARREELYTARRRTNVLGLVLVLAALAGEIIAIFQIRNHWLAQMGMVGVVFGLVWYLGGGRIGFGKHSFGRILPVPVPRRGRGVGLAWVSVLHLLLVAAAALVAWRAAGMLNASWTAGVARWIGWPTLGALARMSWLKIAPLAILLAALGVRWRATGVIALMWLPILFLVFALPIPNIIYTRIAVPLQNIAASGSVLILKLFDVTVNSTASNLELISQDKVLRELTVAEACSGMRLLMAFLALGVAMAYLDYKPIWERVVLVLAAVPIAVFCNVIRVTITCWMYYIDRPAFGQKFMHTFTGILMLVPAFLMLWALAWLLRHLFVEADEAPAAAEVRS